MAAVADILEGSPPYLHTRYLSTAEQNHCLQNPTYCARLTELRRLRQEVQQAQINLDVARRTLGHSKRMLASLKRDMQEFEKQNDFKIDAW